ncbi:MAG: glycosyltransferase family 2 protein, partial [Bacteroidetes bacterium]|nr:glycosyltransferase family 2 protein [Bacteroidota bacterium]
MKFLIIIPAHNEEENIFYCLKSLENQQFQNFDLMVVNDGSTDNTSGVIENFISKSPIKARVKILNLKPSQHQPGAKVVDCFNKGLAMYDLANYDVICKFDADIIFPTN